MRGEVSVSEGDVPPPATIANGDSTVFSLFSGSDRRKKKP